MRSVPARSFGQRIDELVIGPGTDSGERIRRNVRRYEIAERRFEDTSAGEIVAAARKRVAGRTIADDGKIMPAFELR